MTEKRDVTALPLRERDPFANDVLERLARSNADYQRSHGHYIVPLSLRLLDTMTALARAAFVAEHLMQMIDPQTWRDSGGDDGQGHYEGEYRAEQLAREIEEWKVAAS